MNDKTNRTEPFIVYSQSQFNEEYYGGGARGGFTKYSWEDPEQQKQLKLKWEVTHWHSDFNSILFVGCAKGFEVRYFREHNKHAVGIDISQYAITNCDRQVVDYCNLYDGSHIDWGKDAFDMVAAFDVLTLAPDDMLEELCEEIVRVASKKIIIRTIVKNWRNLDDRWDGQDGVSFRYLNFHDWDRHFTKSGKFSLHEAKIHNQYECVIVWSKT